MKTLLKHSSLILLLCFALPAMPAKAVLLNSSFETTDSWTYYSNGGNVSGSYSNSWSSDGTWCFAFVRGTGGTSSNYYAQIAQTNVDFTGITSIVFDCQDTGIDVPLLQFFVGSQLVGEYSNNGHTDGGSSWGSTATVTDIEFDLPIFIGKYDFTIRMQQNLSHSPADPKYYRVDNIRLIPEPATITILSMGSLALLRRKK